MAVLPFNDLYISGCQHCGADLEEWVWIEDDMLFQTNCTCGTEYILEPTAGVLTSEPPDLLDDEADT